MRQVRLIVARELREKLRSKAFLITNLVLLLLVLAAVVLPALLGDDGPDELALVTVGGEADAVATIAAAQAPTFEYDLEVTTAPDEATARALVEDEEVRAALLGDGRLIAREDPSDRLRNLLEGARRIALLDGALADAGVPPDERGDLLAPSPLEVELLEEGDAVEAPEEGVLLTGLALVFVLYGLLIFYGQQVAQGMVQEKQSRVIEVLLATVRPVQLLGGKLLGLGLLGLAQIVLLGGTGLVALQLTGRGDVAPEAVPTVVAGVVWFLLGYAMYATIFALAAAVVAKMEDLQTAMMGPIVLLVGALGVSQFALTDPDGPLARIGGVLPPVAPIYQPLTIALGTASPWTMGLAAMGVMATTAVLIPITARVHAGASLATRNRITVREALRRADR